MSIDLTQQAKTPGQYEADILRRLPLRPVHRHLLPGLVLHHTGKWSRFLKPDDYCEKVWGAGRWLASYILKHPDEFRGKRVLDVGTGTGIVAIAAALAGAEVTALDGNAKAICLTNMNAEANGVSVKTIEQYIDYGTSLPDFDILTATDAMYSGFISDACIQMFKNAAQSTAANRIVYISDQSKWTEIDFLRFKGEVSVPGVRFEIIEGGKRFRTHRSPINNNPVTTVRISMGPQQ